MTTQEKILNISKQEVGTTEFPANSNNVKYNTWYYGRAVSGSSYPWCMVFCCWVFSKAGVSSLFYGGKKTASCTTLKDYAIKNDQWVTSGYKLGDLVMMNFNGGITTQHVGFVTSVQGNIVYTIEGNTSFDEKGNQSNGGAVAERKRPLSCIVGAYRPKYDSIKEPILGKTLAVTAKELKKGCYGEPVKVLQSALNALQNSNLVVDGDFGSGTETALKKYQQSHIQECGSVDGVCGKKTWISILS